MLSIHLESKNLSSTQQMEVAVNGPDGATHLIICTGIANLSSCSHETFSFCVGPLLSRRQFVGAIASGALSTIEAPNNVSAEAHADTGLRAKLVAIIADYDDESSKVKVEVEVASGTATTKLAISYNVSILAELSMY
jgi:hypothetical protein